MGIQRTKANVPPKGRRRTYRALSLPELAERVVRRRSRPALDEIHQNRRVLRTGDNRFVCLAEYLRSLQRHFAGDAELAEQAYYLTIDKFYNLPMARPKTAGSSRQKDPRRKRRGPDCRFYWRAFLQALAERTDGPRGRGCLVEEDLAAGSILQGLVYRQFGLSLMECRRRSNDRTSRYTWKLPGGTICLWMPVSITGRQRRAWLEEHIENPNPRHPGEQQRIQAIVDEQSASSRVVSLTGSGDPKEPAASQRPWPWSVEHEISVKGLAGTVADEKARNLARQRPAIRALGKSRLKKLIRRIFVDLSQDAFKDGELAGEFGLTKATFSRFAGSEWLKHSNRGYAGSVPDLWRNTAQTLAGHPRFVEAAKDSGIWNGVLEMLQLLMQKGEVLP